MLKSINEEVSESLKSRLSDGDKIINIPCVFFCDKDNKIERINILNEVGLAGLKRDVRSKIDNDECTIYTANGVEIPVNTYPYSPNKKVAEIPVFVSKDKVIFPIENLYDKYIGLKLR